MQREFLNREVLADLENRAVSKLDLVTQHGQNIGAFGDLYPVCEEIVVDPLVYRSADEVLDVDRKEARCPTVVDAPVDSQVNVDQGWELFLECPAFLKSELNEVDWRRLLRASF